MRNRPRTKFRPAFPTDWVLRTDATIDGDSISYLDMMERQSAEDQRRARERVMMEEGKAIWRAKKNEELEMELKDQEQVGGTHVHVSGNVFSS